jgi:hypothetical protein
MVQHPEVRQQRGRVAAVAVVLVAVAMMAVPGGVAAFALPEECPDPVWIVWLACLTTNTCANGFEVINDPDPFFPPGFFVRLSQVHPNSYKYTYGNSITGTSATMKISAKDLKALPGWRAHAKDTFQTVDVTLDGPWLFTRPSEPYGLVLGGLRFRFNKADLRCVVPVHLE